MNQVTTGESHKTIFDYPLAPVSIPMDFDNLYPVLRKGIVDRLEQDAVTFLEGLPQRSFSKKGGKNYHTLKYGSRKVKMGGGYKRECGDDINKYVTAVREYVESNQAKEAIRQAWASYHKKR